MKTLLSKRKIQVTIIALLLILGGTYFLYTQSRPRLEVQVTPKDATITVDKEKTSTGAFNERLSKGTHLIEITKEGYSTLQREINLNKDIQLEYALETGEEIIAVTDVQHLINPQIERKIYPEGVTSTSKMIAKDLRREGLILIDNGTVSTIYSGKAQEFSYIHPYLVVAKESNTSELTVINLDTKKSNTLNFTNITQVFSISVSPDAQKLYILGNYNPSTYTSTLFESSLTEAIATRLVEINANVIESIGDNKIFAMGESDFMDAGEAFFVNLDTREVKYLDQANDYVLSPDKKKVIFHTSTKATVFNFEQETTSGDFPSSTTSHYAWDDNRVVIAESLTPGVSIAYYDINTSQKSKSVKIDEMRSTWLHRTIGVIDNTLIIVSVDQEIFRILLPSI